MHDFFYKGNQLMLFDQIIDIYFENSMERLCGQNAELLK